MDADIVSSLQLDSGVRLQKEKEERHDIDEFEGSSKRTIPQDGEGINPGASRPPKMGILPSGVLGEVFGNGGGLSSHPIDNKMRRMVVEEGGNLVGSPIVRGKAMG